MKRKIRYNTLSIIKGEKRNLTVFISSLKENLEDLEGRIEGLEQYHNEYRRFRKGGKVKLERYIVESKFLEEIIEHLEDVNKNIK